MIELIGWLTLGVAVGLVYGLLALGIVLVYKGTKVINFAHPFMGLLCAFITWWLTARAPLPFDAGTRPRFALAALGGLAAVGLNGWLLERTILRHLRDSSRLTQLVATIAVGSGTVGLVTLLFNRGDSATELRVLPTLLPPGWHVGVGNVTVTAAYLQIFLCAPMVAAGLYVFFARTRFGVAIRAAADNADAARLLGISADRVSQFTWVAGSVLAGLAALLIVPISALDVTSLSTGFLVRALAAALVGGLVSLPGALVGGLVVGVAETLLVWRSHTPGLPETLMFGLVIAVLILRPGGLFGTPEDTADTAAFVPPLRDLPLRLRSHPVARWTGRFWAVTAVVFAVAVSRSVGASTNAVLVDVIAFAIVGVSLTVLMGFSGQISLGHWGLAGVGAFAAAIVFGRLEAPVVVGIPMVVVTGMLVSLLIGLPALRIRGLYLAVVTLAFNLAAQLYLFKHEVIAGGSAGQIIDAPRIGPLRLDAFDKRDLFLFSLLVLVGCMWVARNLAATRTGRGMFALRENERAATVLGVEGTTYRLVAFMVSGAMAALGGMVFAFNLGNVAAIDFPTERSLVLVSMVVIGGLGSVEGAVAGAFVVFGLPHLLHFANGWIVNIGTGLLAIVAITHAPAGLAGVLQAARARMVTGLVDLAEADRARRPGPAVSAAPGT